MDQPRPFQPDERYHRMIPPESMLTDTAANHRSSESIPLISESGRKLGVWKFRFPASDSFGLGVLLLIAFIVYLWSFSSFPVLEQRIDVLGDSDAASFMVLFRDFDFQESLGDKTNVEGRSIRDIAEKHKIHHLPYAVIGAGIYEVMSNAYPAIGLPSTLALYSVNALVVCVAIVVLFGLLRRHNPHGNPRLPFLVFYAFALSTWVFGSTPDSWPFTALLLLLYMAALCNERVPRWAAAVVLGLVMLNNIALAAFGLLLVALHAAEHGIGRRAIMLSLRDGAITLVTWALGLSLLSLANPAFRIDRYLAFTFWFKDYTQLDLPMYDPFVWKSIFSNLYFTSVVSNQADPNAPQAAMLLTLRGSLLGAIATIAYGVLIALTGLAVFRWLRSFRHSEAGQHAVGRVAALLPLAGCALMFLVTMILYYRSGFLYSTLVVPLLALVLCRFLDLGRRLDRAIFYPVLALIVVNNFVQVLVFRDALAALS